MSRESFSVLGIQAALPLARTRGGLESNIEAAAKLIRQGLHAHASFGPPIRLVVLPEFAFHGVPFARREKLLGSGIVVSDPREVLEPLADVATTEGCHVVAGSMMQRDEVGGSEEHLFNVSNLIDATRGYHPYRKIFPWTPIEPCDSPLDVQPDEDPFVVVELDIGTVGLTICYDAFFSAVWMALAERGADLITTPAALMHPFDSQTPDDLWRALARVRSMESQTYGLFVNQGSDASQFPPYAWGGGSFLVDPAGHLVAETKLPGLRFVHGQVDLGRLDALRSTRIASCVPVQERNYAEALGRWRLTDKKTRLTGQSDDARHPLVKDSVHRYYNVPTEN